MANYYVFSNMAHTAFSSPKCIYSPESNFVVTKFSGVCNSVLELSGNSGLNGLRLCSRCVTADCGTSVLAAAQYLS